MAKIATKYVADLKMKTEGPEVLYKEVCQSEGSQKNDGLSYKLPRIQAMYVSVQVQGCTHTSFLKSILFTY